MALKILVAGGGFTGCRLASLLSSSSPTAEEAHVEVSIWEKGRGVGGRASTNRLLPDANEPCGDLGAQYITLQGVRSVGSAESGAESERVSGSQGIVDVLVSEGVLREMGVQGEEAQIVDAPERFQGARYAAPLGMASVCKSFLKGRELNVQVGRRLAKISSSNGAGRRFSCEDSDGKVAEFDALVLTIPPHQLCRTDGQGVEFAGQTFLKEIQTLRNSLADSVATQYSSRFALVLYFGPLAWRHMSLGPGWVAKYVDGVPAARYISCEWRKRAGRTNEEEEAEGRGPTFVVHSSVPWGMARFAERTADCEVQKEMVAGFLEVVPQLSEISPEKVHLSRWRYSQCRGVGEVDGFLALSEGMWLAGDYFHGSNFSSCMRSAVETHTAVQKWLAAEEEEKRRQAEHV